MKLLSALMAGLLALQAAHAASTKVWEIGDYDSFLSGRFDGLALDSEGRLTLGPRIEPISALQDSAEAVLWSAAAAPDGALYLGGGHRGRLFRVGPDGETELYWEAPEIEIFAVAVSPKGDVFAGTSPNGKVYRITGKSKAEEVFDPEAEYIWSLLFDDTGALFVGTGPEGKVYRVGADGEAELYFDTEQRHVMSLALDPQGRLLAGTDPNGVLYRISAKDEAFALYDSELPEIRDLSVAPDGSIWAAAMGGGFSLQDQLTQSVSSAVEATTTISVTATASGDSPAGAAAPAPAATKTPKVSMPSPSVINYGVEQSAVLRLTDDGEAEKLWSSTDENVLALALESGGEVIFATDRGGRLYRVAPGEPAALLSQTDEQQITSLTRTDEAFVLTSAHSAGASRLYEEQAESGTYETGIRDAGAVADWGRLSWFGAGSVEFQTRSGNSSRPDKTWSDWSAPLSDSAGGPIQSPPARYLQWRATLRSGDAKPVVERVRVAYLPRNRAPVIEKVEISEESGGSGSSSSSSSSGSSSSAAYSVTVSAAPAGSSGSSEAAETAEKKLNGGSAQAKLAVTWEAEDPDGDDLIARVEFRGEGESVWKTMKADIEESKYAVDSQVLADGRYRFRVTVSDKRSNPPEAAKETKKTSLPVIVDHTPPVVTLAETVAGESVRFTAVDSASIVARAEYSVDAGPWVPVRPRDGVADSLDEAFTVSLDGLDSGERLITLRVLDRAANAGLAKVVVTIP